MMRMCHRLSYHLPIPHPDKPQRPKMGMVVVILTKPKLEVMEPKLKLRAIDNIVVW